MGLRAKQNDGVLSSSREIGRNRRRAPATISEVLEPRLLLASGSGNIEWTTDLGGSAYDTIGPVRVDSAGNGFVGGYTGSASVAGATNSFSGGAGGDAFVAKFNPDGTRAWATYVGGSSDDRVTGIALDRNGDVWFTGYTQSNDLAKANNTWVGGTQAAFVGKIGPDGTLQSTTYLNVSGQDYAADLALDSQDNLLVVGTCSGKASDVFLLKMTTSGTVLWNTTPVSDWYNDYGRAIAVDATDSIWIGGYSGSGGFVAKATADGSLVWRMNLGDDVSAIAIDANGDGIVAGDTFPTNLIGASNQGFGGRDAFVMKIRSAGTVAWSTYVGGTGTDWAGGIALDGRGDALITGGTRSDYLWGGGQLGSDKRGLVAKITANGCWSWAQVLDESQCEMYGIDVAANQDVWVAGNAFDGRADADGLLVKMTAIGTPAGDLSAPSVSAITPKGAQAGNVTISYLLQDSASRSCSIQAEYSIDGGISWRVATRGTGGDGTDALQSDPVGLPHVFVWDSASDLGADLVASVRVRITPTGSSVNADTTADFSLNDHAPTATVSMAIQSPQTNDVLTATATKADIDGNAVFLIYVWKVNGVVKRTFISSTQLTDTFDLSVAGNGDHGDVVTVEVTPTDGIVDGFTASASVTVVNSAPTLSDINSIASGTLARFLGAAPFDGAFSDADPGDGLAMIRIKSLPMHGVLRLANADVLLNQEISRDELATLSYTATARAFITDSFAWNGSDGQLYASGDAMLNLVLNRPPTATVALAPAFAMTSTVLTATATKSDFDGDPVSLTFLWKVNGVVKRTFTSATTLTDSFNLAATGNGDRGDAITVEVTPNDGIVNGATITLSATVFDSEPYFSGVLSKTVSANTTTYFTTVDFMAQFNDADPGDSLQKIQITSLPTQGTLRINGMAVTLYQELNVIHLGMLSYTAPGGANTGDGFQWRMSDGTRYSGRSAATINIVRLQPTSVVSWTTTPEVQYGQVVNLNAVVTGQSGVVPTGSVRFLENDRTVVATLPLVNGQASGQISGLKRGYHSLTARYLGDPTYNRMDATRVLPIHVGAANVVDVLVLYTNSAKAEVSRYYNTTIDNAIYAAVADTNDAFLNSQVDVSLELAAVLPTTYADSGTFHTDLTRLATRGDGFMDNVFALRDTYGADLVSLFVGTGDLAGLGYLMQNDLSLAENATLGFSVILAQESIAPYYTLAHELGHNFGAVHDREHADGPGYFSNSYGYRFTAADGILYHDIMSYDPGETIPYFANPNVSYMGTPTGNAGSNVAATINATASIVKQYRPTKVPLATQTQTALSISSDGLMRTITARVAEATPNPNSPTGTVTFLDGTTRVGSATLVNGQATWAGVLPYGVPHSIRALYQADDFYGDSISAATPLAADFLVDGTDAANNFTVTMSGSLLRVTMDSVVVAEKNAAYVGTLTIRGMGGNDRITVDGTVTNSLILEGNDGNDTIFGGSGNDTIRGNAGNDSLIGNGGNDRIEGGKNDDYIGGSAGTDTIYAGMGYDTALGGLGNDLIFGESEDDVLNGKDGNDTIDGGAGNDALTGGGGNDRLIGGDGNDTLTGGAAADFLIGGYGDDWLYSSGDGIADQLTGGGNFDHATRGPNDVLLDVIEAVLLGAL